MSVVPESPSLELLEQDSKDSAQSTSSTSLASNTTEPACQPEYKVTEGDRGQRKGEGRRGDRERGGSEEGGERRERTKGVI